jgi:hypothetical protein
VQCINKAAILLPIEKVTSSYARAGARVAASLVGLEYAWDVTAVRD